jgi:iron(III) transport system substrate-binding protein
MFFLSLPSGARFMRNSCGLLLFAVTTIVFCSGCIRQPEQEVVVYCALDREFSEPILEKFSHDSGIEVSAKYDVESTKTVGLVTAIINERQRPRCDLFWNNEILHTLRLKKMGLLEVYHVNASESFPAAYRSSDDDWYGFAARARVIIVNTELLPDQKSWPDSIEDFADQKWKGQAAIAKPLFGTTATHAAVLFAEKGTEDASNFFLRLKQVSAIEAGNKQVALAVGQGRYAFGLTDTDDAMIEKSKGKPVAIIFPDQGENQVGTLFIPNSLCLIKGSANSAKARKLAEFLLSPAVESELALSPSAQFPVNPQVKTRSPAQDESTDIKWMEVDFAKAADAWDEAARFLREHFQSAAD